MAFRDALTACIRLISFPTFFHRFKTENLMCVLAVHRNGPKRRLLAEPTHFLKHWCADCQSNIIRKDGFSFKKHYSLHFCVCLTNGSSFHFMYSESRSAKYKHHRKEYYMKCVRV